MQGPEQSRHHSERERVGNGVVVFLTLPILFLVLLFLALACDDPARSASTSDGPAAVASGGATASTPPTTTRPDRPPEPLPPAESDTSGETGTTAGTPAGPVSYQTAESAYHDGRYSEAVGLFQAYVDRKPENPWGRYMLGLSAWKAGDRARAEEALRETVRLDPEHRKGWVNLARVLLDDDRADEAREAVRSALELEPGAGDALRVLGRVAQEEGKADESAEAYRQAIVANPQDAWAMNNLALVRIRHGDFEEALPLLARAVQIRDDVAVFQNNLGVALERTGRYAAAAEAYRRADGLPGGHGKAASSLARIEELAAGPDTVPVELSALADQLVREIGEWREAQERSDRTSPSI